MRIAVLVKQIPKFEEMELGADGRLRRDGIELEMNPYCRRAVSQGRASSRPSAPGSTRHGVHARTAGRRRHAARGDRVGTRARRRHHGVLVTDPAFAGSDTLATAKALAAALDARGAVRPRARRPQLGRRRHRSGRPRARRAARPAVPHRRAPPRDRRRPRRRALRARRRLAAGRGATARDPVARRTAHRPDQGRPAGRAAVPADAHPPRRRRRPRRRVRGGRTRRPRGSGR